mgnify:CR=1 FL=1
MAAVMMLCGGDGLRGRTARAIEIRYLFEISRSGHMGEGREREKQKSPEC